MIDPASVPDAGAFLVRVLRLDPAALVRLRPLPAGPPPAGGEAAGGEVAGGEAAGGEAGRVGVAELWARLPFGVLVARAVRAAGGLDATVRAADLLAAIENATGPAGSDPARTGPAGTGPDVAGPAGTGAVGIGAGRSGGPVLPARRDAEWRWSVPSGAGREVERLAAADVRRVAAAAAATFAAAGAPGRSARPVGERMIRDALLDHVPFTITAPDGTAVAVPQRLVQAVIRMGFVPPPAPDGADAPVGVRVLGRWVGLVARYGTAWYRPGPI